MKIFIVNLLIKITESSVYLRRKIYVKNLSLYKMVRIYIQHSS